MKHIVIAAAIFALPAGSVFAQTPGGDKDKGSGASSASTSNRHSQPPDPLSHKSPGRNKRTRLHRRRYDRPGGGPRVAATPAML
jgi:hypothetical protein